MIFRTLLSACFLAVAIATAVTLPRKNCVVNSDNVEACTDAFLPAAMPVRQEMPCPKMDMTCWCMKAKDYTNDVRRRRGMNKMLAVGPMKQLDNAVRYAGVLGDMGFLEHQDLSSATQEVGCGRFIGGENIAYNYETGDIAKACVDQWENSPGHLENILRDWFEEVVIGFHFESDGRVYCVQTFSMESTSGSGSPSGARCESVSPDSGSAPTEPTTTTMPPSTTTMPPSTTMETPMTTMMTPTTMAPPTNPASMDPMATDGPMMMEPMATDGPMTMMEPMATDEPMMSMMSSAMKTEGNRACRCMELGEKCWSSLGVLSGNRCKPFTSAMNQPMMCKMKCCGYCSYYPNTPPCRSMRVKYVCRSGRM